MEYQNLGTTDIKVSKICLGTMTFGEQNTEAEGHAQLDYALDRGINFIDTAELYSIPPDAKTQGSTERIVGSWIKDRKNRDKFVLATKVTGPSQRLTYIRNPLQFNRDQITTAIDGSLRRLQTDYVALYQLHWPERKTNFFGQRGYKHDPDDQWEDNFAEVLETLQDLIKVGKIRHFGLSNETPWGAMHVLRLSETKKLPRCMSIQNPYSLLNRTYEVGLAEISIRESTGLLAYSPLAFGLLSGKYHRGTADSNARLNKFKVMDRYNGELTQKAAGLYLKIAKKYAVSLAQLSLAFVTSRPFLTSNIIGATTLEQLKENIDSINLQLTEEMLQDIESVHKVLPSPAP